jgi:hypothetical protein
MLKDVAVDDRPLSMESLPKNVLHVFLNDDHGAIKLEFLMFLLFFIFQLLYKLFFLPHDLIPVQEP